jgi:hypothetical protein
VGVNAVQLAAVPFVESVAQLQEQALCPLI